MPIVICSSRFTIGTLIQLNAAGGGAGNCQLKVVTKRLGWTLLHLGRGDAGGFKVPMFDLIDQLFLRRS
jgi:hypothetical protein